MSGAKPRIAALGAGRMGRGIAQVFAYAGHQVALVDFKPREPAAAQALLDDARREIASNLGFLESLGVLSAAQSAAVLDRIAGHPESKADDALARAEVIFEGVPETLAAKEEALGRLSRAARPDAIIASTTSTILVDTLAGFVAGPERFLNAHWLNPAYLIPLVEVSPGAATAPETTQRLTALLEAAGKVPVVCAPSPGYIVPRIQALIMNEAVRMVDEGVASAEEVDRAIRVGFGVRYAVMGPVAFADWGGVDILYYASNYLREALGEARFAPAEAVVAKMREGRLGLGRGGGFYDVDEGDVEAYRRETLTRFVALLRGLDLLAPPAAG